MEGILSGSLCNVLVGANTSSFESFRCNLLVFIADQVSAEGEFVYVGLLSSQVEDTDLWVGDCEGSNFNCQYTFNESSLCLVSILTTSVVSALGERLVLAVPVATSWSSTHFDKIDRGQVVVAIGKKVEIE